MLYAEGKVIERDLVAARFWFEAAQYRHLKAADHALVAFGDLEKRIAALNYKTAEPQK